MRLRPAVLAAVLVAPLAARAQTPTTVTFADKACTGTGTNYSASPVDVQGFRFAGNVLGVGFVTPCSGSAFYAGTTTLWYNNAFPSTTTLTQLSGNPFSISSIDLSSVFSAAQFVGFAGTLVGGATVTQSFIAPGGTGPLRTATFTFLPTFTNLTSLQVSGAQYQFTNVRLNQGTAAVVPEPRTWALLGVGITGLGGAAAWRRHTA